MISCKASSATGCFVPPSRKRTRRRRNHRARQQYRSGHRGTRALNSDFNSSQLVVANVSLRHIVPSLFESRRLTGVLPKSYSDSIRWVEAPNQPQILGFNDGSQGRSPHRSPFGQHFMMLVTPGILKMLWFGQMAKINARRLMRVSYGHKATNFTAGG